MGTPLIVVKGQIAVCHPVILSIIEYKKAPHQRGYIEVSIFYLITAQSSSETLSQRLLRSIPFALQ